MPFIRFCLTAIIFVLSSTVVFAQDKTPKVDDLDALLSSDKPAKQEEKNPLYNAFKQAKWTWNAVGYNFTKHNEQQDQGRGDDTKFRQFYTQLLMDTWIEVMKYEIKVDLLLQYGSEKDQYGPSRMAYFSQLYVKKKFETSDLIFGYKYIEDGISTLYSPAKRIAKYDADHPTDPDKLGVWQASWTYYYTGNNSTEVRLLPYFQKSRYPPEPARWSAGKGDYDIVDSDLTGQLDTDYQITEKKIRHHLTDSGFMIKQKMTVEGVDFFVSAYEGYLPNPVLKRVSANHYEKQYIKGGILAAGFSTVQGKWEWHGEGVCQIPENRKEDAYINYVFGSEYDLNTFMKIDAIDSAKLIVEYSNEWVLEDQNHPDYPANQRSSRFGRNAIYILQKVDINDKNKVSYGAIYNISKKDNTHRLTYERKFKEGKSIETFYEWFNGGEKTHFGRWKENDRIVVKFTKKF